MILNRSTASPIPLVTAALLLTGCWTPPVATVQPKGPPGLIQKGVVAESVMGPATVQSIDPGAPTIALQRAGDASAQTYRVGRKVAGLDRIAVGKTVYAVVVERLTIYTSSLTAADGVPGAVVSGVKVLSVDPSYRLLSLQYPTGQSETVKVGREVKLKQIQAGDDVTIEPVEVISVSAHKPWWR